MERASRKRYRFKTPKILTALTTSGTQMPKSTKYNYLRFRLRARPRLRVCQGVSAIAMDHIVIRWPPKPRSGGPPGRSSWTSSLIRLGTIDRSAAVSSRAGYSTEWVASSGAPFRDVDDGRGRSDLTVVSVTAHFKSGPDLAGGAAMSINSLMALHAVASRRNLLSEGRETAARGGKR
jgi:hypothetical protein